SGAGEDRKEAVTFAATLHQGPAVPLNHDGRQGVVTGEGAAHRFRMLLPEPRATLDVGEEERDRAGWTECGPGHRLALPEYARACYRDAAWLGIPNCASDVMLASRPSISSGRRRGPLRWGIPPRPVASWRGMV